MKCEIVSPSEEVFSQLPQLLYGQSEAKGTTKTPPVHLWKALVMHENGRAQARSRGHGFLLEQFKALKDKIQPKAGDVAMPVLPIVLLCNLAVGASSIIARFNARKPESVPVEKILQQISKYKVNRITASSFFVTRISEQVLKSGINLPEVRQIFTGGAPVFPMEAQTYLSAWPNADIQIVYGSTEAEPISSISAKSLLKSNTTDGLLVGEIYTNTKLRIIPISNQALRFANEESFQAYQLPPGEIGEIIVSGDHVLSNYFNSPEAWKQNKIEIGQELWHRTGDAGFLDEQGRLLLTGRCKQMISDEQGYISPFLYEYRLQNMPGVVTGTILQVKKQLIVVIEATETAIKDSLRQQILRVIPHKTVRVKFVNRMPRDPRHHSKIDYVRLKEISIIRVRNIL